MRVSIGFLVKRVDQLLRYTGDHGLLRPGINDEGYAAIKNILGALKITCEDFHRGEEHCEIRTVQQIDNDIC